MLTKEGVAADDVVVTNLETPDPGSNLNMIVATNDHDRVLFSIIDYLHILLNNIVFTNHYWTRPGDDPDKWMKDGVGSYGHISNKSGGLTHHARL